MEKRKIQLIAGTTYSISLPKEWVKNNKLKEKSVLSIIENNDKTLTLTSEKKEDKNIKNISLDIDNHSNNIDQLIFSLYYLGAENIEINSKENIPKEIKSRIRRAIQNMSGSEIVYEDKNKIIIKVLLDKSKIDINQTIYRVWLLIND